MIWNDSAPMELLSRMPSKLTKESLGAIQNVIDRDKYICSMAYNRDLCGSYAPFCALCDKSGKFPCAIAYLKMKNKEGLVYEIALSEDEPAAVESKGESDVSEVLPDPPTDLLGEPVLDVAEVKTGEAEAAEADKAEEGEPVQLEITEDLRERVELSKRVRIAVARRKHK